MRRVILGLIAIIMVFLYSCQKENNAAPAGAFPIKLAITAIQPASPLAGLPFTITVSALGSANTPANVTENTSFLISASGGTGRLGGTITGTIQAGTSSVTLSNLIYSASTPNLVLTATRMLGNNLTSASSAGFAVQNASPTVASSYQITGIAPTSPVAGAPFSITVSSVNFTGAPTNVTTNANFQISASGPGALSGTVSGTIAAGTNNVVVSGLTYSTANSALVLTATRVSGESLAPATSQNIVVQAASGGGGGGSNPSRLLVAGVIPGSPTKDSLFSIVVSSLDNLGLPVSVTADTEVRLTASGPGQLTGTLNGTILAGTSFVLFNNLRYSAATTSLVITATRVSGNALSAGASANITVVGSCTPPPVATNIIGTWRGSFQGQVGPGSSTFNANGTGTSTAPDGPFTLEATVNGTVVTLTDFRWRIVNNELLLDYFVPANPTVISANGTFPIVANACGSIVVDFTGLGNLTLIP